MDLKGIEDGNVATNTLGIILGLTRLVKISRSCWSYQLNIANEKLVLNLVYHTMAKS